MYVHCGNENGSEYESKRKMMITPCGFLRNDVLYARCIKLFFALFHSLCLGQIRIEGY